MIEYTVLRFTGQSMGVCIPPEFSSDTGGAGLLKEIPLYAYVRGNTLVYRTTRESLSGEIYLTFYKPSYRQERSTATITLPPQWHRAKRLQPGDKVHCTWNHNELMYTAPLKKENHENQ